MVAEPRTLTPVTAPATSLHRKLAEVMAEVDRIPKNGTAPAAMGGFKFVQVGDAADVIRKALASRNVSMLPSTVEILSEVEHATKSGGTMTTQTIRTTWALTDGETGETVSIQSLGTGADTGDKFSPKAQTNSMKYALLMGFLLSTGDDPELADTSDRRQARPSRPAAPPRPTGPVSDRDSGGLVGIAEAGKGQADFELRQTPTGWALAFRLVEGRKGMKVLALDGLAESLAEHRAAIEGQRVTCFGAVTDETFTPKDTGKPVTYQVLRLERIETPAGAFPAPAESAQDAPQEPDGFEAAWGPLA